MHNDSYPSNSRIVIAAILDSFHAAAAAANYHNYFQHLAPKGIFAGTDATEYWTKGSFAIWAKPFFDRKKAWTFKSIDRHIYLSKDGCVAWFDELLSTQMKICRGSGVLSYTAKGGWAIEQYILSMTIPNTISKIVIPAKAAAEDSIINLLQR
jgi:hypothetical protein